MNPEGWIVLAVGVATVVAQLWTAHRRNRLAEKELEVAEKQLEAAQAALRNELQAVLVFARGRLSTEEAVVHVRNGGRYAAIDLRFDCKDESGEVVGSGSTALVGPMSEEVIRVRLGSVERREAFSRCRNVTARWSDGLGKREEKVPLLLR